MSQKRITVKKYGMKKDYFSKWKCKRKSQNEKTVLLEKPIFVKRIVFTFSKNENPKDGFKQTFEKSRSSFLKEMFERLGGFPNKFFDFCGAEKIKKASIASTRPSLLGRVYISVPSLLGGVYISMHCLLVYNTDVQLAMLGILGA